MTLGSYRKRTDLKRNTLDINTVLKHHNHTIAHRWFTNVTTMPAFIFEILKQLSQQYALTEGKEFTNFRFPIDTICVNEFVTEWGEYLLPEYDKPSSQETAFML